MARAETLLRHRDVRRGRECVLPRVRKRTSGRGRHEPLWVPCGQLQCTRRNQANCRVPDDYLLKSKRPLLMGREVLAVVVAGWNPGI